MLQGQASVTALLTAEARARHQLIDRPRVFDDPIAVRILGDAGESRLRRPPRRQDIMSTAGRGMLVVRSRVGEDALHAAVERGVAQYVVLGAGLDTFAYRNPYPASCLQVFEVDHPATQAWKRHMLCEAGIDPPASVRFVPVDLASQPLAQALRAGGVRGDVPTLFSWLGVTMYLEPAAALATLRTVAAWPAGSGIVFDFLYRPRGWDIPNRLLLRLLARRYAAMGEPWIGTFDAAALADEMRNMGFADVRHITRPQLNQQYFSGRTDGLKARARRMGGMMVATV